MRLFTILFPGNQYSQNKTLPVTWYDGTAQPPARIINLLEGQKRPSQGSIVVGTKGVMLIPHVGMPKLFPEKKFKDHKVEIVEKNAPLAQFYRCGAR